MLRSCGALDQARSQCQPPGSGPEGGARAMMHAARRGPRPIFCAPVARVCAAALLVLFAAAPAIAAETQKENETPEKATRLEPLEVAGERIEPLTAPSSSRQRHDMTRIPAEIGRASCRERG